jgi:hypothetical protein
MNLMSRRITKLKICIVGMMIGIGQDLSGCFQYYIISVSLATASSDLSQPFLSNPANRKATHKAISNPSIISITNIEIKYSA